MWFSSKINIYVKHNNYIHKYSDTMYNIAADIIDLGFVNLIKAEWRS